MKLKLSDIEVGKISKIKKHIGLNGEIPATIYTVWDSNNNVRYSGSSKDGEKIKLKEIDIDPLDDFIDANFSNSHKNTIPIDSEVCHKNYLEYLLKCWKDHLGIVFTPDILWHTLLGEVTGIIKKDPEKYRNIFTQSEESETISVYSNSIDILPIDKIVEVLKEKVLFDAELMLPEFSTSTVNSNWAKNCLFADMCSPYYKYTMFFCGYPCIDIRGEKEDYELIYNKWQEISKLLPEENEYCETVSSFLKDITNNLNSPEYWEKVFKIERCGSGSDVELLGIWRYLYKEIPKIKYVTNFATHVSEVKYKQLETQKKYKMNSGLFYSKMEGDFLVPDFGFIITEIN